jgi:hypothetical protein
MACSSYSGSEQGLTARNVRRPCTAAWSELHLLEEATTTRSFPLEPPIPPQPALLDISSCSKSQTSGLPRRPLFVPQTRRPCASFAARRPSYSTCCAFLYTATSPPTLNQRTQRPFLARCITINPPAYHLLASAAAKGSTLPGQ